MRGARAAQIGAVAALAQRLQDEAGPLSVLLTLPDAAPQILPESLPGAEMLVEPQPEPGRTAARAFLDTWTPDMLLWLRGDLDPALLTEAAARDLPAILAEAGPEALHLISGGWRPGALRAALRRFDRILVRDGSALARLRRAGADDAGMELSGKLEDTVAVPGCNDRERRDIADGLGARPVWLAADTPLDEAALLAQAHAVANRRTHRLLLILEARNRPDGPEMAARLQAAGFQTALRSAEQDAVETTQVYVADGDGELGLWYRLAPITYIGGTLTGQGRRHPFEAAALGSVVVHGRATSPFADSYRQLAAAGASRQVSGPEGLGRTVEGLLEPDKAATMAHAAWDVTSSGADVTNRLIMLIAEMGDAPRKGA